MRFASRFFKVYLAFVNCEARVSQLPSERSLAGIAVIKSVIGLSITVLEGGAIASYDKVTKNWMDKLAEFQVFSPGQFVA
jgi:hypothetical protein